MYDYSWVGGDFMPITTEGCQGPGGKYFDNWINMLTGKPMNPTQNTIKREDTYKRLPDKLIQDIQLAVPQKLGGDGWYKRKAQEYGVGWTSVRNYYLCEHNRYFGTQLYALHRAIPKKQEFVKITKEEHEHLLDCKQEVETLKEQVKELEANYYHMMEMNRHLEKQLCRKEPKRDSDKPRWYTGGY